MKMNYYKELPNYYKEDYIIDAKDNKKTSIKFTLLSIVLMVLIIVPFVPRVIKLFKNYSIGDEIILYYLGFMVTLVLYIVLHELVHGLLYKIFTHEKLVFGMTFTVAFCGVPNLYVNKKTALFSILAPLTFFTILFLPIIFITNNPLLCAFTTFLFGIHIGGCIGDIWGAYILIFKYRKIPVLMNDTGPKQTFYIPIDIKK